MGISGAAFFSSLARRQSSLQTNTAWSGLGYHAAVADDFDLHTFFGKAGPRSNRRHTLPANGLYRTLAMDFLFERSHQQRHQRRCQRSPDYQSIFSARDCSGGGDRGAPHRLRCIIFDSRWNDGLLPGRRVVKNPDATIVDWAGNAADSGCGHTGLGP